MKKDFTAIYCFVDDFIKNLENNLPAINSSKFKPSVSNYLSISELLTILIGGFVASIAKYDDIANATRIIP